MTTKLTFYKSSYSAQNQNCVEAAPLPSGAALRDSKHPDTALAFPASEWAAFLAAAQHAEL